jgi:hypothetical protein
VALEHWGLALWAQGPGSGCRHCSVWELALWERVLAPELGEPARKAKVQHQGRDCRNMRRKRFVPLNDKGSLIAVPLHADVHESDGRSSIVSTEPMKSLIANIDRVETSSGWLPMNYPSATT